MFSFDPRILEAWKRTPKPGAQLAARTSGDQADLYLFDAIGDLSMLGMEGVTPKDFVAQLNSVQSAKRVVLHVNSPGGDFADGLTMANALTDFARTHQVDVVVEGVAASIASVVAISGTRTLMASPEAELMVHEARTGLMVFATAADLQASAARLQDLNRSLADIYARKTGAAPADMLALLAKGDTYMKGPEAVARKFADGIVGQEPAPKKGATAQQRDRIRALRIESALDSGASPVRPAGKPVVK